ncbi:hypothetical protein [Pseudotamlana carrageenivorans]|uniref:Uncharacterized protein n=1 Tax=Pseudotamlana carrageenivorans TaxID=2069432 RepID=A0A2I7SFV6_9FLAO|nr:hypothetical protein [Tamlana carrageenivorans]AUS04777.1 hypothetical protein C1A40_04485 [Tamlana carrageenivorans]
MKNKTEVKSATKHLIMFYAFLGLINIINSQNTKYLLFDNSKDTIVVDIDKTKYYKIDKNLFDITRFNEIDTICKNNISEKSYTTVDQLCIEGKRISDSLFSEERKKKEIRIVETNNQIFDKIYILEELTKWKYKRTRVWWIDY